MHEAHHQAYNATENVVCYSIYPSEKQTQPVGDEEKEHFRIFELTHSIPICESVSPVSNYRWHGMSDDEFDAYRKRLTDEVFEYMKRAEEEQGMDFTMAIAHHTFLNPLVMRDVLVRREKELNKPRVPLFDFVHGTALKMYVHELDPSEQEEFPMRFHKLMMEENVFGDGGISGAFAISKDQKTKLTEIFPSFPVDKMVISPNGVNQSLFYPRDKSIQELLKDEANTPVWPKSRPTDDVVDGYKKTVVFVGKFANWKRLDAVLRAAKLWEAQGDDTCTVIIGSGPPEDVELYEKLADELELKHTYMIGPKPQPVLAEFFSAANVGVFPSYSEPFGMVFIECCACGTPTIGADSGGPKDFISPEVGELIPEPENKYDWDALEKSLFEAVQRSLSEDWKTTKGPACIALATEKYSVKHQCEELLLGVDRLLSCEAEVAAEVAAKSKSSAPVTTAEDPAAAKMKAEEEAEAAEAEAESAPPVAEAVKVEEEADEVVQAAAVVEEVPKPETPKVETPKVETPKVETPKVETPKVEAPKGGCVVC